MISTKYFFAFEILRYIRFNNVLMITSKVNSGDIHLYFLLKLCVNEEDIFGYIEIEMNDISAICFVFDFFFDVFFLQSKRFSFRTESIAHNKTIIC